MHFYEIFWAKRVDAHYVNLFLQGFYIINFRNPFKIIIRPRLISGILLGSFQLSNSRDVKHLIFIQQIALLESWYD